MTSKRIPRQPRAIAPIKRPLILRRYLAPRAAENPPKTGDKGDARPRSLHMQHPALARHHNVGAGLTALDVHAMRWERPTLGTLVPVPLYLVPQGAMFFTPSTVPAVGREQTLYYVAQEEPVSISRATRTVEYLGAGAHAGVRCIYRAEFYWSEIVYMQSNRAAELYGERYYTLLDAYRQLLSVESEVISIQFIRSLGECLADKYKRTR